MPHKRKVALLPGHRCVLPTLPLAATACQCGRTPISPSSGWPGCSVSSSRGSTCFAKFATATPPRNVPLGCSERLREFDRPALIVWAAEDRFVSREHGSRLAALLPDTRLVKLTDCATLVPEDQPERLAELLTDFLVGTGADPVTA
jgi:pimeloyl-ACP methyl ester carboxylesterase